MSRFVNPVDIFTETAGVERFSEKLTNELLNIDRVLVLTRGDDVHSENCLQPIMTVLDNKEVKLMESSISNPDLEDIVELRSEIGGFNYQYIVAVGGGSVLDIAKVLIALQSIAIRDVNQLRKIVVEADYVSTNGPLTPWTAIPTTSGTGSEVTSWATVWDKALTKKYSVTDERLYANSAVIITELTVSVPLRVSVSTALDALCHATEAYWSKFTNPITRVYAIEAIKRIRKHLPLLEHSLDDLEVRKQLALGSLFAGLAFSNTRTTACHSISYPLTIMYDIDHGVAVSMTLGKLLKINASKIIELDLLLEAFGVNKIEQVEHFIFNIFKQYGLPKQLRDYGIIQKDLTKIVNHSFTKGRMDNNPVNLERKNITYVLEQLI